MTVEPTPGISCDRLGCPNPGTVPGVCTEDGDSWRVVVCAAHAVDQDRFTPDTAVLAAPGTDEVDEVRRLALVAAEKAWEIRAEEAQAASDQGAGRFVPDEWADLPESRHRSLAREQQPIVRAVLAAARPSVLSSALDGGLVLTARCENVSEPDGIPCTGALRYHWGQPEAACDTCGGRCGIAVAAWTSVAAARPGAAAAPEELREAVAEALKAYDRGHLGRRETTDAVLVVTQAAQETAVAAARVEARREALEGAARTVEVRASRHANGQSPDGVTRAVLAESECRSVADELRRLADGEPT